MEQQFEGWPIDRLVDELENKVESDVPFEHRGAIQPYLNELKQRVKVFTGDLSVADAAKQSSTSASTG